MNITTTRPDIQAVQKLPTPSRNSIRKPIVALLAIAAVLIAGIAVAAVMAMRTGPSHNTYWSQGYQYGQSHTAAASSAPQPTAQWCGLAAYQVSGYSYIGQEHQWASGCTAALAGQS